MTKKRTEQLLNAARTVVSFAAQKPCTKLGV